jgi:hypothetical protein
MSFPLSEIIYIINPQKSHLGGKERTNKEALVKDRVDKASPMLIEYFFKITIILKVEFLFCQQCSIPVTLPAAALEVFFQGQHRVVVMVRVLRHVIPVHKYSVNKWNKECTE